MKISLKIVSLQVEDKVTDFVVWGEVNSGTQPYDYALLIPQEIYLELLKAVAVDEVSFFNTLGLYAILNGTYQFMENPVLKKEVYDAIGRSSKKGT